MIVAFVDYQIGKTNHDVFLYNDEGELITGTVVSPSSIADYCLGHKANNIVFSGPKDLTKPIGEQILLLASTKYNNHPVEVSYE